VLSGEKQNRLSVKRHICGLMRTKNRPALAPLKQLDLRLAQRGSAYLSLAPDKSVPTSCEVLFVRLSSHLNTSAELEALAHCITALVNSSILHFPANLFWDFDCILGCAVRCGVLSDKPTADYLFEYSSKLEELFAMYGCKSLIYFQYTHDFLYGYDFERWQGRAVLSEPECHEFSVSYIDFLIRKGAAISRQIEREVPGYDRMPAGQFRNSFSYPRDAATEEKVLRAVVAEGALPIVAWSYDGQQKREAGRQYRDERAVIAASVTENERPN
jgi:hypothetical protein